MKIASSQVAISNEHHREEVNARRVSMAKSAGQGTGSAAAVQISQRQLAQSRMESTLQTMNPGNGRNPVIPGNGQNLVVPGSPGDTAKAGKAGEKVGEDLNGHYDRSLMLMKMMLERMTGKKIELFDAHGLNDKAGQVQTGQGQVPVGPGGPQGQQGGNPNDIMVVENYHYEKESNHLQFAGVIEMENGKQTKFAMSVEFSQEYESISVETMKREELKDPLVISFSTQPVKLSNEKFEFDIDSDNEDDEIALLEAGFGFLALDKNGDGVINDGSELFGAQSGNGFAELAQYDDNQDGFIDENDAIYKDLSIWIKNESEDLQVSLEQKGIGAIGLDNVDSPYTIRDGDEKLGIIRKSGFYVNENGSTGLVQQLDYVV